MPELPTLFDLSGRVAIITGGAGLLGQEFCRTLVEAGAYVVVADIDHAAASRVVDELKMGNNSVSRALAVQVDVTQPVSVHNMCETALVNFGRLDILVNSAALDPKFDPQHEDSHTNNFEDYPLEAWNQSISVNLTGMFLCCQGVARHMVTQSKGVIVNICSTYGLVGPDQRIYQSPGKPTRYKPVYYSVTKAGVLGLTHYLATYYANTEIRVNALTPGGVFNNHYETFLKAYSARTVMGRMARKDELNGALLFLVSDASSYMTGANLVVDGGWTAW